MKTKTICVNCGDPARLGGSSVGERAHLGYCAACYRAWRASMRETRLLERGLVPDAIRRTRFDSRPSHPAAHSA